MHYEAPSSWQLCRSRLDKQHDQHMRNPTTRPSSRGSESHDHRDMRNNEFWRPSAADDLVKDLPKSKLAMRDDLTWVGQTAVNVPVR